MYIKAYFSELLILSSFWNVSTSVPEHPEPENS